MGSSTVVLCFGPCRRKCDAGIRGSETERDRAAIRIDNPAAGDADDW